MKRLTKEDDSTTVKSSVSTMGNQPVHSHLTNFLDGPRT
jgi:hypothetical protein